GLYSLAGRQKGAADGAADGAIAWPNLRPEDADGSAVVAIDGVVVRNASRRVNATAAGDDLGTAGDCVGRIRVVGVLDLLRRTRLHGWRRDQGRTHDDDGTEDDQ